LISFGEPAGTRTQDHLIKSLLAKPFFVGKSMVTVPNFKTAHVIEATLKEGIWEQVQILSLDCGN
jgi:hypothetical protein